MDWLILLWFQLIEKMALYYKNNIDLFVWTKVISLKIMMSLLETSKMIQGSRL